MQLLLPNAHTNERTEKTSEYDLIPSWKIFNHLICIPAPILEKLDLRTFKNLLEFDLTGFKNCLSSHSQDILMLEYQFYLIPASLPV